MPLRERNKLLEAGGYAHIYKQTPLAAEAMRHVRGVLEFILQRHEPYGAMVLDTYSNLLMANGPAAALMAGLVDPSLMAPAQPGVPARAAKRAAARLPSARLATLHRQSKRGPAAAAGARRNARWAR